MQMDESREDLLKLGLSGQQKGNIQPNESRQREGEPINYVLAAVTKGLTRSIFQQEELFQAYSSRRGDL